ncbi:hypothetical protein K490DRAFT_65036 [Saccharata proteae CBS 121410]|uniref:Uncharacterized protein n=1 Tax=Saccharata proteae CBS 121410 TaxID=1314787 RepID=A0A9P4HUM7_9PEZI|nr:hypothetical protein K490DRAFT_65036 [Saccharata proteae CBS 121410]
MDDQQVAACKSVVTQIAAMLESDPNMWETYLPSARGVVTAIDAVSSIETTDWTWIVEVLQNLAFVEPDEGGVTDIGNWCLSQWLAILEHNPDYWPALKGLGQYWLYRAQPALSRIHEQERSSSSSSGKSYGATSRSEEGARISSPEYVEARGLLAPSIENYAKAVQTAYAEGSLSGNLLEKAAEAHMSIGNVTSSRSNQQYFCQVVRYLQMAEGIADYQMPQHLQEWLDEYSPLLS